ncbi:MAG: hypothetical protein M3296_07290 [Actinomycetota bacterium]|nr:hypothetical protein [Actinomycetota bacterium]
MTIRALPTLRVRRAGAARVARPDLRERLAAGAEIVIRRALQRDAVVLRQLAELDGTSPLPEGEHLLAEIDGRPVAAIDVRTGRVVSDPFVPTAAADLLSLRARQGRR